MSEKSPPALGGTTFEGLKRTNQHGAEYWSARDLQPMLGYSQWRRFQQAIERAITSCTESGNNSDHHFAGAGKPISGGKGAVQVVQDYHLSRFACYLIAQNCESTIRGFTSSRTEERVSAIAVAISTRRLWPHQRERRICTSAK